MAKQILYYPTIEIPDVAWLKNALLYWDEVSTIVPSRNFQLYGNIAMLSEYGFYKPIFPEDPRWWDQNAAALLFLLLKTSDRLHVRHLQR